jgi:hypothetical protein
MTPPKSNPQVSPCDTEVPDEPRHMPEEPQTKAEALGQVHLERGPNPLEFGLLAETPEELKPVFQSLRDRNKTQAQVRQERDLNAILARRLGRSLYEVELEELLLREARAMARARLNGCGTPEAQLALSDSIWTSLIQPHKDYQNNAFRIRYYDFHRILFHEGFSSPGDWTLAEMACTAGSVTTDMHPIADSGPTREEAGQRALREQVPTLQIPGVSLSSGCDGYLLILRRAMEKRGLNPPKLAPALRARLPSGLQLKIDRSTVYRIITGATTRPQPAIVQALITELCLSGEEAEVVRSGLRSPGRNRTEEPKE